MISDSLMHWYPFCKQARHKPESQVPARSAFLHVLIYAAVMCCNCHVISSDPAVPLDRGKMCTRHIPVIEEDLMDALRTFWETAEPVALGA